MIRVVLAGVFALALGGCATVTRGTSNQIQINSDPIAAEARTSMGHQCVTPCTLTVGRKDEFSVVISKAGYEPQTIEIRTKIAEAGAIGFAGNVVVGGIVGMAADATTGATLEHYPNPVTVRLTPARGGPAVPGAPGRDRRKSQPPVAVRPAPPPQAEPAAPEPVLSESDRVMMQRN